MILDPETRRKDSLTVSTVFGFVFLFLLVSGEISVASRLDRISISYAYFDHARVLYSSSRPVCFFAGVNETLGLGKGEQVTQRPGVIVQKN